MSYENFTNWLICDYSFTLEDLYYGRRNSEIREAMISIISWAQDPYTVEFISRKMINVETHGIILPDTEFYVSMWKGELRIVVLNGPK